MRKKHGFHPVAICKRTWLCMGITLTVFAILALFLPPSVIRNTPMVQVGILIHGFLIAAAISVTGLIDRSECLHIRIHPLFRGAFVTVLVHLDYAIYTWPDQFLFWKMLLCAAAFGGLLDLFATELFGEGKKLLQK